MAVWREGAIGGFANTAMDLTLRLDNAVALPTCPTAATVTTATMRSLIW